LSICRLARVAIHCSVAADLLSLALPALQLRRRSA
jgi:hypothetical protein